MARTSNCLLLNRVSITLGTAWLKFVLNKHIYGYRFRKSVVSRVRFTDYFIRVQKAKYKLRSSEAVGARGWILKLNYNQFQQDTMY